MPNVLQNTSPILRYSLNLCDYCENLSAQFYKIGSLHTDFAYSKNNYSDAYDYVSYMLNNSIHITTFI